jgi:hypothetical protein
MSNDSHLFRTREQLEGEGCVLHGNVFEKDGEQFLPLYEAKMIHQFDHRWATYEGLQTRDLTHEEKNFPDYLVLGRYWVNANDVLAKITSLGWSKEWFFGIRNITNSTNERTVVGSIFPLNAVGHSLPLWLPFSSNVQYLLAVLSSFVCDFASRFKIGGMNFTFYIAQQIPVPPAERIGNSNQLNLGDTIFKWLQPRILELTYTAHDLVPFAADCGFDGQPFRWDEKRRFLLRCELDAAFFHLYLPSKSDGMWKKSEDETESELRVLTNAFATPRDAVEYIMETFSIIKRKDEAEYGEYRTRRVIMEIYDELQQASATGKVYRTRLDPPPGDNKCRHPSSS